jgi:cytochrome c-type biogenesis protein CcmH
MSDSPEMAPPAAAAHPEDRTRPSRALVAGIVAGILVVAIAGYVKTGSPQLAGIGAPAQVAARPPGAATPSDAAASDARQRSLEQIASMVDGLAERLKTRPDDAEGWTMLARSYTLLGRFAEALPAYRRASELQPRNAGLLADHADASAASQGTLANPETVQLLERALAIDPQQPKALALAAPWPTSAATSRRPSLTGRRSPTRCRPAARWRSRCRRAFAEARQRAAGAAASARQAPARARRPAASAPATAPARATAAAPAPGPASAAISGTVTLAPALAGNAAPNDTVFVFARASEGARMPLAIVRARVADLPLAFTLDDSSGDVAGGPPVGGDARGRRRAHQPERQCHAPAGRLHRRVGTGDARNARPVDPHRPGGREPLSAPAGAAPP